MIARMRIFAGPNGSGKSTLAHWLSRDYTVNLYRHINADVLFAEISESQRTACPFFMDTASLLAFVREFRQPVGEEKAEDKDEEPFQKIDSRR